MTQVHIAHDGSGFRVYRTESGRDRAYVGPSWTTPREAARYADALEVTANPLRASVEEVPIAPVPLIGAVRVTSSTEPRKRGSRHEDSRQ